MKPRNILSRVIFLLTFIALTNIVRAQVVSGPSDAVTAPPTSAASVGKVVCYGQTITLTGPQDANNANFPVYNWYKVNSSGTAQLSTENGVTYTEASAAPGYYNYQLVTQNAGGCTSPSSGVFQVYVLPQLNVSITTPNSSVCTNSGTTVLTAVTSVTSGYTFNYQWTMNGVNIPGATSSTYSVTGQTTPGTVVYAVNVSYTLSSACTSTATQSIIVAPLPTKPLITATN
jgi:hypothetical protein